MSQDNDTRFPFPKEDTFVSKIFKSLKRTFAFPAIEEFSWFFGTVFWCSAFITNPKTNDNYSTNALLILFVLSMIPHVVMTRGLIPDCQKDNNVLRVIFWWIIFIIGWIWFMSGLFIAISISIRYFAAFISWCSIILPLQLILLNISQYFMQNSNSLHNHIHYNSAPFEQLDTLQLSQNIRRSDTFKTKMI